MNTVLIATHGNKDVSWINELNPDIDVKIYCAIVDETTLTNDPKKTYITPNIGFDANIYLQYIIKNYDNLPERTLFVHHHKEDWTQDDPLPFIINNLNWELDDYFNICARKYYKSFINHFAEFDNANIKLQQWKKWLNDYWVFDIPKVSIEDLTFYVGAQFMCHRNLILRHPKSYYLKLHTWLILTDLHQTISGRFFEYMWHYILTGNPIDKQYERNQILKL